MSNYFDTTVLLVPRLSVVIFKMFVYLFSINLSKTIRLPPKTNLLLIYVIMHQIRLNNQIGQPLLAKNFPNTTLFLQVNPRDNYNVDMPKFRFRIKKICFNILRLTLYKIMRY